MERLGRWDWMDLDKGNGSSCINNKNKSQCSVWIDQLCNQDWATLQQVIILAG